MTFKHFVAISIRATATRAGRRDFTSGVLKHPELFERMDSEERKRAAILLFDRDSDAAEITKMLALSRKLAAEGYSLRKAG